MTYEFVCETCGEIHENKEKAEACCGRFYCRTCNTWYWKKEYADDCCAVNEDEPE